MAEEHGINGGQGKAGRSGAPSPAQTTASGSDDMPEAARSGPAARSVVPAGDGADQIADTIDRERIEAAWANLAQGGRRCTEGRSK